MILPIVHQVWDMTITHNLDTESVFSSFLDVNKDQPIESFKVWRPSLS